MRVKKNGRTYEFQWDDKKPPSQEIIERIIAQQDADAGTYTRDTSQDAIDNAIASMAAEPQLSNAPAEKSKSLTDRLKHTLDSNKSPVRNILQRHVFGGIDPQDVYENLTEDLWNPGEAGRNIDTAIERGFKKLFGEPEGVGNLPGAQSIRSDDEVPNLMEFFGENIAPRDAKDFALEALPIANEVRKGVRATNVRNAAIEEGKDKLLGLADDLIDSGSHIPSERKRSILPVSQEQQIKNVLKEEGLPDDLLGDVQSQWTGDATIDDILRSMESEGKLPPRQYEDFDLDLELGSAAERGKRSGQAGAIKIRKNSPEKIALQETINEWRKQGLEDDEIVQTLKELRNTGNISDMERDAINTFLAIQRRAQLQASGHIVSGTKIKNVVPANATKSAVPGNPPGKRVRVTAGGNVVQGRNVIGTTQGAPAGHYIPTSGGQPLPIPTATNQRALNISPRQQGASPVQQATAAATIPAGPRDPTLLENILGIPKSMKSVIDLPALRQSVIPSILHPSSSFPALRDAFRSLKESNYNQIVQDLANRPRAGQYEAFDLAVGDPGTRQQFPSLIPDKLPIWGKYIQQPSERAFNAYQSTIRANEFDRLAEMFEARGNPLTGDDYQGIANLVNDMTGQGKLPWDMDEKFGGALNAMFYSPKFQMSLASRLNPVNYTSYGKYGSLAGAEGAKDMLKFGGGLGAGLYGADQVFDDNVELDPRSSSLGLSFGNVHGPDFFGGYKPVLNLGSRLATGERKTAGGDVIPLDEEAGRLMGSTNLLKDFFRQKLAPGVPSMLGDVGLGSDRKTGTYKNVVGEDISLPYKDLPEWADIPNVPERWILSQITPMFPEETYEAFDELGPAALPITAAGFLGAGSNTYDPKDKSYRPKRRSGSRGSSSSKAGNWY